MRNQATTVASAVMLVAVLAGCGPSDEGDDSGRTGTLIVAVSTTGPAPDADGYLLEVASQAAEAIPSNGDFALHDLAAGAYQVRLTGLAPNCMVQGANPVQVQVVEDTDARTAFVVRCMDGSGVRVTTTSTAEDPDSNGYLLSIGGGTPQWIPSVGVQIVAARGIGAVPFSLGDLEPHCAVDPGNPATVMLTPAVEGTLGIAVSCSPGVSVVATAAGTDLPAMRGIAAAIDRVVGEVGFSSFLDSSGTATFRRVPLGAHAVSLTRVPSNCTAANLSQSVSVRADAIIMASFALTCVRRPRLYVRVSTVGTNIDPDGYQLVSYGWARTADPDIRLRIPVFSLSIPNNGITSGMSTYAGRGYSFALEGLAPNCVMTSFSPSSFTMTAEDLTISVEVSCG